MIPDPLFRRINRLIQPRFDPSLSVFHRLPSFDEPPLLATAISISPSLLANSGYIQRLFLIPSSPFLLSPPPLHSIFMLIPYTAPTFETSYSLAAYQILTANAIKAYLVYI